MDFIFTLPTRPCLSRSKKHDLSFDPVLRIGHLGAELACHESHLVSPWVSISSNPKHEPASKSNTIFGKDTNHMSLILNSNPPHGFTSRKRTAWSPKQEMRRRAAKKAKLLGREAPPRDLDVGGLRSPLGFLLRKHLKKQQCT